MSKTLLIAGTGKMARNIGLFFLRKGFRVHWTSFNRDFLLSLENKIAKDITRLQKIYPDTIASDPVGFFILNQDSIPAPDYILECTTESLANKQKIITALSHFLDTNHAILLSNTSSILPGTMHPQCIGCHFFFPVEMNETIELVFPKTLDSKHKEKIMRDIMAWGIEPLVQSEETAFAVNRLLLPLQAESFRLLQAGYNPIFVNDATVSDLLPIGQLTLMDSIGLDTIHASVTQYLSRIDKSNVYDYLPLQKGLEALILQGKQGNKNKNGLLCGSALPWESRPHTDDTTTLMQHFLFLLLNTCRAFIQSQQLTCPQLNHIFSQIFQSTHTYNDIELHYPIAKTHSVLTSTYSKTNISYFQPSL